ncbi:MAG: PspC domain-containing protein [Acidimicrobiales bacterium]|nr:PspC domain-containing protein [Acidimicrobiales bacterium]
MTTAGTPHAGMTTPPTAVEPYKLRRAREGRMLAGVAAGLATASGLDVALVRICLGLSVITGWGLGVLAYFLLWIVIPEEQPSRGRYVEPAPEPTARIIRYVLLGGAALMVLRSFGWFWPNSGPHNDFGFGGLVGLVLLALGVGVLVSRHRSDAWDTAPSATTTAPPPSATFTPWTAPGTTPTDDDVSDHYDDGDHDDSRDDAVSFTGPLRGVAETVHRDITSALAEARSDEGRAKKPGGAALGWARVAGWLVFLWWCAGLLVMLALWRFGAIEVEGPWLLFGVCWGAFALVLNALIRVRKASVVLLTLFALLVPIGMAQGMVTTDGPVGTRTMRPLTANAVNNYRQSLGKLELDFSTTRFATSRPTQVNARIGTGALIITIPNNVSATVVTRIDAGDYEVLGKRTAGGVSQRETLRFAGCEGAPHLQLNLRGGAGWIEVQRENGTPEPTCATPVAPPA